MLPTKLTKKNVIFDFEVFPEWWVVCFRDEADPLSISYISSNTKNYIALLQEKLQDCRLIGFNCKWYDLYIYNAILCYQSPEQVYQVSQDIINEVKTKWTANFNHYKWDWIDLFNDWRFGSLKMYEANAGLSIVESKVPFGKKNLTPAEKEEIILYCHADTWAAYKLWQDRKDYFSIHEFVSQTYCVPATKAYQKTMAALTAEAMLATKPLNILPEDKRKDIYVLDYIKSVLGDISPFDYLLVNDKDERVFILDGDKYILGTGGIHSTLFDDSDDDKQASLTIAETNDTMQLWTMDFTQYYPNMLTKFKLMPRSVPQIGVTRYVDMINKVRELKVLVTNESDPDIKKQLSSKRDKYKVLINAVSGAMRSKYSKFYDPARIITMCATGQFLIIAIATDLKRTFPGTEIIQTNTDGIYLYTPKNADVESKMKEIIGKINFEIEIEKADKIIQRNVNNYILEINGKVKSKGSWLYNQRSKFKPCNYAVCRIAVYNYLVYNTPIEQTIYADKDIMDFVKCAKTGSTFEETIYCKDGVDYQTSATNRFIASKNVKEGVLYKVKYNKDGVPSRHLVPDCPPNTLLLNESVDSYEFDDLNIDYDFYIKEANELVPKIFHILQ